MAKPRINSIQEVAYHRNGVDGNGFHAIRFLADTDKRREAHFLGMVFDGKGDCGVICLDMIPFDGVRSGQNSWRAEEFEKELRAAIAARWPEDADDES